MNKLILLCLVGLLLSGCAQTVVSKRHVEQVGGKEITYIIVKQGNSILDHSMVCDRYGPDGALLAHDVFSNNGILEAIGGQALTTLVPAASALGLVK